jgi:hypothetical protein
MTFFNPTVLFGLLAASIPLILHLLNLRKQRKIEFSTLMFLKELKKTKIKNLKIKRLILLALRTLAIICIVLAFARPTIDTSLPLLGNYGNTSSVILVDNSMSMDISDEYGNRLNRAKNETRAILELMKEGDEAAIIPLADLGAGDTKYTLSRNAEFVKKDLNNIKMSYSSANIEKGLREASQLLNSSLNLTRETFIISDFQRSAFNKEFKDSTPIASNIYNLFLMPIAQNSKTELKNVSIDSINVISQIFQKDKAVEAEIFVNNHSNDKIEALTIALYFNGAKVSQKTLDLQAKEKKSVLVSAVPQSSGLTSAYAELEADALDGDNRAYFGFMLPEQPKVALVGSGAQLKYLRTALAAKLGAQNLVDLQEIQSSSIASADMSKFDIIVCGFGPYREADFQRLKQFALNGGAILIFADASTPRDIFNLGMNELGFGAISDRLFSDDQPGIFSKVDKNHPLFRGVFKSGTESKEIVESPRIQKAFTVNGGLQIIEMPGGSFLSETKIGEGKAIYCAVSPDNEWSNLPFTGLFPTLIYRATSYLSSKQSSAIYCKSGQDLSIPIPKKFASYSSFKVVDPNGKETFAPALPLPSGSVLTLQGLKIPGCYKIYTMQNEPVAIGAINTEASESMLESPDKNYIQDFVRSLTGDKSHIHFIDRNDRLKDKIARARVGSELWQLFVILALLCLIAETLVARNSKAESEEE